ncbi:hypothetical protein BRC93_10585 [Halobacteriales archaeon QS_5_70_15]|nr:MAG: hypothetical protein BRC93_10585 [Halobacteriales archaeon QS_5_70_15]
MSVDATDESYVVLADLPGFENEEIDLRFDDGTLHIGATHDVSDGEYARSRRVRESVSIDDEVVDGIETTYRNGVLEVHVPVEGMEDEDDPPHRHRVNARGRADAVDGRGPGRRSFRPISTDRPRSEPLRRLTAVLPVETARSPHRHRSTASRPAWSRDCGLPRRGSPRSSSSPHGRDPSTDPPAPTLQPDGSPLDRLVRAGARSATGCSG